MYLCSCLEANSWKLWSFNLLILRSFKGSMCRVIIGRSKFYTCSWFWYAIQQTKNHFFTEANSNQCFPLPAIVSFPLPAILSTQWLEEGGTGLNRLQWRNVYLFAGLHTKTDCRCINLATPILRSVCIKFAFMTRKCSAVWKKAFVFTNFLISRWRLIKFSFGNVFVGSWRWQRPYSHGKAESGRLSRQWTPVKDWFYGMCMCVISTLLQFGYFIFMIILIVVHRLFLTLYMQVLYYLCKQQLVQ